MIKASYGGCRHLAEALQGMRHDNGRPLCVLYGAHKDVQAEAAVNGAQWSGTDGAVSQGPIVTFNLLRADGSFVGHRYHHCFSRIASLCYS